MTPAAVAELAAGRPLIPVWQNQAGGLTFEVESETEGFFVKWAPAGSRIDLAAEATRMVWAGAYTTVPTPLGQGSDPAGSWLMTSRLPGTNAVTDAWLRDPAIAVTAIGRGLRALHDALPVADCPFSWSAEKRLQEIHRLAAAGTLDPAGWDPVHQSLSLDEALKRLEQVPPVDRLVVCHGDACAPNTLIDSTGQCSGHVDLGALGTADRWADIAVATWSLEWNYGPGWEETMLSAYGVAPDRERTAYYRLLWDLGP